MISCSYLQRTTLEQELGLAAYLVKADSRPPQNPGPGSDLLESDTEKLSSTDNEEEEGQEHSKTSCTGKADHVTYAVMTSILVALTSRQLPALIQPAAPAKPRQ